MTLKRCSWGNCNSDSRYFHKPHMQNVFFIPFPKPRRDLEKCLRWISLCGRPHSRLNVTKINEDKFLCSKHFVGENGPTTEYPDPLQADPLAIKKKPSRSSDKTAELNKEGNRSQNTDDTNKTMDQMFSCEKCSRMFRSRKGLAVHNHCHADEQQSGCALCKKVLCTPDDVLNHRCVMTPTLIDVPDNSNNTIRAQPTFCTRCYDILVTPDEIRFHECTTNQHNYEDDFFICGVCRAAYPTKKHLIGHLYVHTGEASIECTLCRVGFTSADSLEKHACLGPVRRQ